MNTFPMLPITARQAINRSRAILDHSALKVTGRTSSNVVAFVVAANANAVASIWPTLSSTAASTDDDLPEPLAIVTIMCEPMVRTAAAAVVVALVVVSMMIDDEPFVAAAAIDEFIAIIIVVIG